LLGVVVVGLAVDLALRGIAAAQPAPPAPPDATGTTTSTQLTPAEQAFLDGRALLDEGKHAEACVKFETSIRLDPEAAGTLLNLGLCNERLGKTATALAWFRRAQFRAAESGMTDYEDVAKNSTFSLSVRVPTIRITVTDAPPNSPVFVDDKQIPDVELGKVEIDPGTHVIELRIAGKPPVRAEITIKDGEQDVEVPLAGPKPPPPPPPPPKDVVYDEIDHGKTRRWVAYALAAGGAGLWFGSVMVSLTAKDMHDDSEHPEDWRDAQQKARFGGTSLFILGTAAIATGVYLWVTAPGVERVERTVKRGVSPAVGNDQVGVVVYGAF
jgi:hypothetical protein